MFPLVYYNHLPVHIVIRVLLNCYKGFLIVIIKFAMYLTCFILKLPMRCIEDMEHVEVMMNRTFYNEKAFMN